MNVIAMHGRQRLAACVALLWSSGSMAQERTRSVDCDTGATIRAALSQLTPGDTLLVRGLCRENLLIGPEVVAITLDGQSTAVIEHPDSTQPPGPNAHPIYIRGRMITITGFTIRGGEDGIHLSGPAHAVIAGNIITHNRVSGIHMDKGSVAQIVGNTISDNGNAGIKVTEESYARIGFLIPPDPQPRSNIIVRNQGPGIVVHLGSTAWIVGNSVSSNGGDGVVVDRGATADIIGNGISRNGGNGITVSRNSGVVFHSSGTARPEGPNSSDEPGSNRGFGVVCSSASFIEGPLGTLSGVRGAKVIEGECVDSTTPR